MDRLLYEHSVSCQGYLIIPFSLGQMSDDVPIYSVQLLAAQGHRDALHRAVSPAGTCGTSIASVVAIAQDFLVEHTAYTDGSHLDYFKLRYTYRHNLIITVSMQGKWFYDHYPPTHLTNIAAPKIFDSEAECLDWIQSGLAHHSP